MSTASLHSLLLSLSRNQGPVARKRRKACSTVMVAGVVRRYEVSEGSKRRRSSLVLRRIRDLGRLVSVNGASVPQSAARGDLGGFLREVADYVACLRLQVKVMRSIVDVLSRNSDGSTPCTPQ